MIEHGYSSNKWMMKQIIMSADPRYLKAAVLQVVDELHAGPVTRYAVLDMLVQITSTGRYEPEERVTSITTDALNIANKLFSDYFSTGETPEKRSEEDINEEVRKFRETLGDMPTAEDPIDPPAEKSKENE